MRIPFTRTVVVVATLGLCCIVTTAAQAASSGLAAFSFDLSGGAQIPVPDLLSLEGNGASCTTSTSDASETCNAEIDDTAQQVTMKGTASFAGDATHKPATGAVTFACDDSINAQISVNIDPALLDDPNEDQGSGDDGSPTSGTGSVGSLLQSLTGSGNQSCSFELQLGSAGTLDGTTAGTVQLVNDPTGTGIDVTGQYAATVSSGTGEFADTVGSGEFAQAEDLSLDDGTDNLVAPSAPDTDTDGLSRQAATINSKMMLRLRTGTGTPLLVAPSTMTAGAESMLSVATVPAASCTVVAKLGRRSIILGSGHSGRSSGLVTIAHPALERLSIGRWSLTATCGSKHSAARSLQVS